MIIFEFEITVCGTICAKNEEDAISMLLENPALYGEVEIDSLDSSIDGGDYDYGELDTDIMELYDTNE